MKKITIVGAGISGATLANILANDDWDVTIYEKNDFVGGNCYDFYDKKNVLIHKYGPHIFHTSNEKVYKFFTKFTKLNGYVNKVLVNTNNKMFPLPINFKTIEIVCPDDAAYIISLLKKNFANKKTITFYDLIALKDEKIKVFSNFVANNVIYNYTSKMWGVKFDQVNRDTINRVKIVLSYEHNYFPDDKYQGLPVDSYTRIIQRMLSHKNIKILRYTNALDYFSFKDDKVYFNGKEFNQPLVWCGPLDEALDYKFGILPYRSLNIKFKTFKKQQFQDTAVINYSSHKKMTRIAEYKLMTLQEDCPDYTTISKEYPGQFKIKSRKFNTRFYPIINDANISLYNQYLQYFKKIKNFFPLGRLAQYKYFDMDDSIDQAMQLADNIINNYEEI